MLFMVQNLKVLLISQFYLIWAGITRETHQNYFSVKLSGVLAIVKSTNISPYFICMTVPLTVISI